MWLKIVCFPIRILMLPILIIFSFFCVILKTVLWTIKSLQEAKFEGVGLVLFFIMYMCGFGILQIFFCFVFCCIRLCVFYLFLGGKKRLVAILSSHTIYEIEEAKFDTNFEEKIIKRILSIKDKKEENIEDSNSI